MTSIFNYGEIYETFPERKWNTLQIKWSSSAISHANPWELQKLEAGMLFCSPQQLNGKGIPELEQTPTLDPDIQQQLQSELKEVSEKFPCFTDFRGPVLLNMHKQYSSRIFYPCYMNLISRRCGLFHLSFVFFLVSAFSNFLG